MADRKPYEHLTPDQQRAIHVWLRMHRVEPMWTPDDALIEFDPVFGEWRIEQQSRDECSIPYRGPDHRFVRHVIRRAALAELPWPEMTLTDVVRRHHDGRGPINVHLRVTPEAYADVPRRDPAPANLWEPQLLAGLLGLRGIPTVIADDLGDDVWQLVDNLTKRVLARGCLVLDPSQPTESMFDAASEVDRG